jgi:ArsR family transcriptional regulator
MIKANIHQKNDINTNITPNSSVEINSLNPNPHILPGFHALSDPIRIRILELLQQQEMCVCDLSEKLEVPQSKLSFHLKTLKEASLVLSHQEGRWMYYCLNLSQLVVLEQYLANFRRCSQMLPPRIC